MLDRFLTVRAYALSRMVAIVGLSVCAWIYAGDVDVSAVPDRRTYVCGDTVVLIVDIDIPRGYHVCANPVGPGPGKPLELLPDRGDGVRWIEVRGSSPRRVGEGNAWVWAYRNRAVLYAVGVVTRQRSGMVEGTFVIEGQLCSNGCELFRRTVGYRLRIADGVAAGRSFDAAPLYRMRFARARAMPARVPGLLSAAQGADAKKSAGTMSRKGERYGSASAAQLESAGRFPEEESAATAVVGVDTGSVSPADTTDRWGHPLTWDYTPQETRRRYNILLALLAGFVGGLFLNVMSGVLPVLGITVFALSEDRAASRVRTLVRSLAFAAGILAVFAVLATLASFVNFLWGEQFRSPQALAATVCIIVVFALGLFDFYSLALPGSPTVVGRGRQEGMGNDFFRGVIATVMVTPSSGPLLGATLAWTLSQSVAVIYAVFMAIGIGMALPYVVLASRASLMRWVPKPGRWMDGCKHAMGFLLLGLALYLMVRLRAEMIVATLVACLALTLAIDAYQRFASLNASRLRRGVTAGVAVVLAAAGFQFSFGVLLPLSSAARSDAQQNKERLVWRAFSREALEEAHARGQHVLVDFTAAWCLDCQYNKAVVIESRVVRRLLEQKQVVLLRADLTTENRAAESLLNHLGSVSVPFLAVFPGDDPYHPVVLRDVITRSGLRAVLERLPEK